MPNPLLVNWLNSMTWQADFYGRSCAVRREDAEFAWGPFMRSPAGRFLETKRFAKGILRKLGLDRGTALSIQWLHEHADELWGTRNLLADDLSKLLFDSTLILRITGFQRFYFPRIDFDDLIEIVAERRFAEDGFPHDYLGVPLGVFDVRLLDRPGLDPIRVITRKIQLDLVNSYRQYLVRRNGSSISPVPGDVVYDCGACMGEVSMLFAGMVAPKGEVHLFDPIPLHARFCELQASMNPALDVDLHIVTSAVGGHTRVIDAPQGDSNVIVPNAVVDPDRFSYTTLDDYAAKQPRKVDFIKMDIEGAEMEALSGAAGVIGEFKPRLAISGYHKPQDLWEIPAKLKALNPDYEITFGHHTPIFWESVFYASDRGTGKGA